MSTKSFVLQSIMTTSLSFGHFHNPTKEDYPLDFEYVEAPRERVPPCASLQAVCKAHPQRNTGWGKLGRLL